MSEYGSNLPYENIGKMSVVKGAFDHNPLLYLKKSGRWQISLRS